MCHKVLVVNTGEDSLTLIERDFSTKTILLCEMETVGIPEIYKDVKQLGPYNLDIGNDGRVYVVNAYDDSIMKIDFEENKLIGFMKVGKNPTCIKIFKGKIYVLNTDSNSISIIDEKTFSLIEDISVGEKPTDMIIDEKKFKMYITNGNCFTLNILDLLKTEMSLISLKKHPIKLMIEEDRLFILSYVNNGVTNYSNLSELKIEDNRIIMSIDIKGIFTDFIKVKGRELFYISNGEDEYLYKISKEDINFSKMYLGGMPGNIRIGENKIYVANILKDSIVIIDEKTNKIIKNIKVGKEPNGFILL